jgi:hypothetical protein
MFLLPNPKNKKYRLIIMLSGIAAKKRFSNNLLKLPYRGTGSQ